MVQYPVLLKKFHLGIEDKTNYFNVTYNGSVLSFLFLVMKWWKMLLYIFYSTLWILLCLNYYICWSPKILVYNLHLLVLLMLFNLYCMHGSHILVGTPKRWCLSTSHLINLQLANHSALSALQPESMPVKLGFHGVRLRHQHAPQSPGWAMVKRELFLCLANTLHPWPTLIILFVLL